MTPNGQTGSPGDNDNAVREADLQAYVDGQLEGRRRAAIEAHLASRPDEAARLAAYRRQNIGLHALFDPRPSNRSGSGQIPDRLATLAGRLDAQLHAPSPRPRQPSRLRRLAASIALLASAGAGGWLALDSVVGRDDALVSLTRQATEAPSPVPLEAAGSERQVVAWLAAQPGNLPTTMPDLAGLGFTLAGERLITTIDGRPAAQLLYRDAAGERVTLTMRVGGTAGKTSFTFAREGEAARFLWQDAQMAYSLAGTMAQEKLLRIAEAVSASLRKGPPTLPQHDAAEATPDLPAAPPAETAPTPVAPAPSLDTVPLIPVPAGDAGSAPKET